MTIDMGNKKINIPEGHHISKALLTEIESAVGAEDDASKNALKEALTGKGFTLD